MGWNRIYRYLDCIITILFHSSTIIGCFTAPCLVKLQSLWSWRWPVVIISEVLTLHGGNKQIPLAWPVTLTEGLEVEIYLYVLPFFYLDTWGRKLPTSPDTQIGWDLPMASHKILARLFKSRSIWRLKSRTQTNSSSLTYTLRFEGLSST